jgi:branched-chain amino acid transport system permease protein/neutral amino acid transport system permease protein
VIDIVQLVIVGVIVGSIIGLGSMGLTLAYGVMKFANFAHGDSMALGMFLAFIVVGDLGWAGGNIGSLSFGWGMIPALALAMVGVAALNVGADATIYRRLRSRRAGIITMAVASLGLGIMVRAVIQMIWGASPQRYATGINPAWTLPGDLKIKPDQVFIIALTLAVSVGLYLLLYRTRLGKAMRATSDNPELAEIAGIDTERIRLSTWAIAGALTALAGVMLAIQAQLRFNAGFEFLLPMFAATILGGIGNPWGALVGGLIVGVTQEVSTEWIDPGLKPGVPFVLLILILLVRPRGIFGSSV